MIDHYRFINVFRKHGKSTRKTISKYYKGLINPGISKQHTDHLYYLDYTSFLVIIQNHNVYEIAIIIHFCKKII